LQPVVRKEEPLPATTRNRIKVLGGSSVFSVPERVAFEEGLFDAHGLDVTSETDWNSRPHVIKDPARDPLALFESGVHDTFNMCEWGVLNRLERTERPAHIVYLRPAIVAQAIVSFDPRLQEPHDLAGQEVGIVETTGQHFTTLKLLEGSLSRDQIKLVHGGQVADLLEATRTGRFPAATVMEPYVSLAVKQGAHLLGALFYRGAQAFADTVDEDTQRAYVAAVNDAVDLINADPEKYKPHVLKPVEGQLELSELRSDYYRYVHAQPYTQERFADQYGWMRDWGLVAGDKAYDDIIDSSALTVS
jgi:NitT/TauT family transport system substrate-binding protein